MAPTTQSVTDQTTSRLLLLDGHSLAYRAFFALPVENFSTTTGQHTNAVFGFTSMLINVLRDEQPTHIAVAFDKSRQTFRLAEYAEYKAKRNKTPDEFSSQLPLIKEVLDALRIEHLHLEGYEADDIIATLATQAEADGLDVLILTGDRDSLQLVSDRTTVLYPSRGVSELARMTPAAVEAKYGVPAGPLPRARRHRGRDLRQPARACPASGPGSRPAGSTSTTASTTSSPGPTRSPARRVRRSASTSATSSATGGSTPWSPTWTCRSRPPTWRCGPGTATRCTTSSTAWSSGCCATGSSRP